MESAIHPPEELEEAKIEHASWLKAPKELRHYDTKANCGGSRSRESAYMAGYLSAAVELKRYSIHDLLKSKLNEIKKTARQEQKDFRRNAGAGKHFPIFQKQEQVTARRLRGRHDYFDIANQAFAEAIESFAAIDNRRGTTGVPKAWFEKFLSRLLKRWHIEVNSWAHQGPHPDGQDVLPPSPLTILESMKTLWPRESDYPAEFIDNRNDDYGDGDGDGDGDVKSEPSWQS